jgi:hypothetical protein
MSSQLTDIDREFFLGLYRNAVAFYQPRIEKRTGVAMGAIHVWPYEELHQHSVKAFRRQIGFVRALLYRRRLRRYWEARKAESAELAHRCAAAYFGNAIYVSFSLESGCHEENVALATVHELSHALWEMLEGQPFGTQRFATSAERQKFELLVEGHATYGERVWFRDTYPECVRSTLRLRRPSPETIHARGLRRVRELVEQFGQQILLDIPKRWRSL